MEPNEPTSKFEPEEAQLACHQILMVHPNMEGASSYIQMHLLASTPSRPLMVAERAG